MSSPNDRTDSGRYLVSCGNPQKLNEFITASYKDPSLQLIDTIGPLGAPHTAVYEMAQSKASELEHRFSQQSELRIEPDRPLSMFGTP